MNRIEFMDQLKDLLREISAEEREEALQYYEDYFADAGEEHEAEVIRELGSPQKVAATIKADLKCGSTDAGLFTECGYEDERFTAKATPAKRSDGDEKQESTQESESGYRYNRGTEAERNGQEKSGYTYRNPDPQEQKKPATSLGLKILLIILIILIGIPGYDPARNRTDLSCDLTGNCRICIFCRFGTRSSWDFDRRDRGNCRSE